MKITIGIIAIWVVLIGIADHNRQAPTAQEIASHCEQVDLGNGSFVCK